MLTDNLLPMLTPNRFIEMKSTNKLGGGRNSAAKLSVFFNFLYEYEAIEYIHANSRHVRRFLDFLIYGDLNDLKITDPSTNLMEANFFRDCGSVPAEQSENAERGALGTDETDSKAGADETANS